MNNLMQSFDIIVKEYNKVMVFYNTIPFLELLKEQFFHKVHNKRDSKKSSFTVKTLTGSIAHIVQTNMYRSEGRPVLVGYEPNVDIYLDWGFDPKYLEDGESWNHKYVIKNVSKDVIAYITQTRVSNFP